MSEHTIEVRANGPLGVDSVRIDGKDIEDVEQCSVSFSRSKATEVHLVGRPGGASIEVKGAVVIHDQVDPSTIMSALVNWLTKVDTASLEKEALAQMGWGDDSPFAAKVVEALIRRAKDGVS